ncbi:MAG: formate dehydrogenase accessory sulfurtransferase FdhD [Thermus sp.]|uniref:formate dehydrogenase accessory sulfurtransferase FdhD n=1 Tax=unclassified Thermus TaxID=2619321 RepID=UPI00059D9168|nr:MULTISPECIES: formate dehydrogenase accessory sulfurtransferase FdhD [unclassified Thermus]MCS6869007.1 formate dehydrogenase accessory sulfurtransferase FdhD [Thermus sp.]MCS7218920.1 formate dehydrogenase accessory sulfurtransferase FdhD [Thermus sp.]MCX7848905.1 formate dehydrogenase accessory sulfurtransferase FdhD [Thermus sp.]MDW8017351.1 formate dehydrogenase accessory sulfurtransferase FdhD [Thermus sp.]MDW8356849.1 formate dehydrogenase accessory sulfurtransferase FdhD [Thermus sp.
MWRYQGGGFYPEDFPLPEEGRLVLVVNGEPWSAFSYTPGDEAYLAVGHLFLSGALSHPQGVRLRVGEGMVLVDLPEAPQRGLGVRDSGCAAGLRYGEPRLAPLPQVPLDPELPLVLLARLRQGTARYARTRGIHGAALFDLSGHLLYLNEDIGRHNAVDRLAGFMLLEGIMPPVLVATTGRVSQEMAAKAIGMGAVLLASRTGATLPAVALACRYGLALATYVRPTGYRLYAPGGMPVAGQVPRP